MIVKNKNNNEAYEVFDIAYNKNGYPHFLIYKDGEWIRMSAKHFKPYSPEDDESSFDKMVKVVFNN
jgi:hypothetical protein